MEAIDVYCQYNREDCAKCPIHDNCHRADKLSKIKRLSRSELENCFIRAWESLDRVEQRVIELSGVK